ncbi:MAG: hypothetical protein Q4G35_09335 [Propionibacteriaceae bacterium]|nr:hypothetical protein [Propionibacteriaceae bacterium]
MIPWTPVPPETPLKKLWSQSLFADDDGGKAIVFTVTVPSLPKRADAGPRGRGGSLRVTSHSATGFPRRRDETVPDYVPVSGFCISHGLVPRRIVAIPPLEWPPFRAPVLRAAEGPITFADLVRNGPPASVRLQGALAMADAVKTTYGRMLTDIAYRIEQAALFDSSVPTTRSFDNVLALWDSLNPASASEDDLVRLAGTLKLAFDTARAHAETVGLDHLPETARADARRAASAARLAVGAKTDGERAAAQEQVMRILRSLALYYLPHPDHLQITDGRP